MTEHIGLVFAANLDRIMGDTRAEIFSDVLICIILTTSQINQHRGIVPIKKDGKRICMAMPVCWRLSASQRRSAVRYLQQRYAISERRGCQVTGSARSTHRYQSIRPRQATLRRRIRELAESRVRYGYRRIHILLKREGIHVNKKRVHRLYCEEGLRLRAGVQGAI